MTETAQAKMRILRVPALLGLGGAVALVGVGAWVAGGRRVSSALDRRHTRCSASA